MTAKRSRHARRVFTLALFLAGALTVSACGTARRSEPLRGPLAVADPQVRRGQIVFMNNCHKCHPGGEGGLGPALNNKALPGFLKKFQVRHGLGKMPAFDEERISDEDLDALMEYLGALRHHEGNPPLAKEG